MENEIQFQNLNLELTASIYKEDTVGLLSANWEADLQRFFSTLLNLPIELIDAGDAPHDFIIKTLTGTLRYQPSENARYFNNLEELEDAHQGVTIQNGVLYIRPDFDDWLIRGDGIRQTSADILISDITWVQFQPID